MAEFAATVRCPLACGHEHPVKIAKNSRPYISCDWMGNRFFGNTEMSRAVFTRGGASPPAASRNPEDDGSEYSYSCPKCGRGIAEGQGRCSCGEPLLWEEDEEPTEEPEPKEEPFL